MDDLKDIKPQQSIELLKALHILTRDGCMNQDSRRKLKQVYHLYQLIAPYLEKALASNTDFSLVDHGAGKSYLGFILYDLFLKEKGGQLYAIEHRLDLIEKARALSETLKFDRMHFFASDIKDSLEDSALPSKVSMVTALHACDTATDDAILFGLKKNAQFIIVVPCCQAEVAHTLKKEKSDQLKHTLSELWRHPIHTREFGSHLTNVLRCLFLEGMGYKVTVTELVGWEHSIKNELIMAENIHQPKKIALDRLEEILKTCHLESLRHRFLPII
jgi:hypothetical protein